MIEAIAETDDVLMEKFFAEEEITEAEWEIIKLVGRGLSNKEISAELSLSEGTVRNYLSTILNKLDLRDRTQLAIWEEQSGSAKYGRR